MRKRIIIPLFICLIIIVVISVINMKTTYLGAYTKVISFGNISFKYNSNRRVLLKKVNIYKNGNKIKGFIKSQKSNNGYDYYAISRTNNKIDLDYLVASGTLLDLKVINSNNVEIDNQSLVVINNMLGTNLLLDNVFNYSVISYDIDNDITEEEVAFVTYLEEDTIVTRIFIYDDNSVINIINEEKELDEEGTSYNLASIIDFNKDNKYEIVISKVDGDSQPTYYNIYRYNNGTIKEIK